MRARLAAGRAMRTRRIFGTPRARASGRAWIELACMAALAALWLGLASRIHVNASWSDDAWGYAAVPLFGEEPKLGDRVLFEPPPGVGAPIPYLKTVRGLPGMTVAVDEDGTVRLDGVPAGTAKTHALDGRPLAAIATGTIPPGHYFLHADHPDSHDSRYAEIGLVPRSRILGRAVALPDVAWLGLEGPLVGPEDAGTAGDFEASPVRLPAGAAP